MHIGIDIDGVLTDMMNFKYRKGKEYFHKEIIDENGVDVDEIFGVSKEERDAFWRDCFYDYIFTQPARENAREVIGRLHARGHKIYIITSRRAKNEYPFYDAKHYKNATRDFLDRNGIYYDELAFYPYPKTRAVKDKSLDIFIDDMDANIIELSKHIKVLIFDTVYNREVTVPNTKRVYNWLEIEEYLNEIDT